MSYWPVRGLPFLSVRYPWKLKAVPIGTAGATARLNPKSRVMRSAFFMATSVFSFELLLCLIFMVVIVSLVLAASWFVQTVKMFSGGERKAHALHAIAR